MLFTEVGADADYYVHLANWFLKDVLAFFVQR